MKDYLPIISAVIGFISALVTLFLREWWVDYRTKKKNRRNALQIANIFLLNELRANINEYERSIINGFGLKDALENDWGGAESPGGFWNSHYHGFIIKREGWDRINIDLVRMDFQLAKEIYEIYRRFEILDQSRGKPTSTLKLEDFKGFSDAYNSLIARLENAL
jgi:hypothetical protein